MCWSSDHYLTCLIITLITELGRICITDCFTDRQTSPVMLSARMNITFLIISEVVTDSQQSWNLTIDSVTPFQRSDIFCTHQNPCRCWRAPSHQCDVKTFLSGFLTEACLSLVSMFAGLSLFQGGSPLYTIGFGLTCLMWHCRAIIPRLLHLSSASHFSSFLSLSLWWQASRFPSRCSWHTRQRSWNFTLYRNIAQQSPLQE